jgi:hypothetical protein
MINNKYINIFKNKPLKSLSVPKVIVFDLDETLGSFAHLEILWNTLLLYNQNNILFNDLLDLYPEFRRYGIINILEYVYSKKLSGECSNIFLYTNNQNSTTWVNMICDYFCYKLNIIKPNKLFDQIIYAFKIKNKIIEKLRTSKKKQHCDLISCTLIPNNTEICFMDDTYYNDMNTNRVYYIQPLSYQHNLNNMEIMNRFFSSKLTHNIQNNNINRNILYNNLNYVENNSTNFNKLLDTNIKVTHKIMYYIKDFFLSNDKKNKTKKNIHNLNRYTRRKK